MATPTDSVVNVDIIFAGGGTAACVAAGRLAKANPHLKILLVEAGPNNLNNPLVTNPAIFPAHLAPGSKTIWDYKSNASAFLDGREVHVQTGGILGGGSSVNFMGYYRPAAVDYDGWNTDGWSSKEMIALSKKAETYNPRAEGLSLKTHGTEGPVQVSDGGYRGRFFETGLQSLRDAGVHKELADIQDFETVGGFAPMSRYVGNDGKRQDAAHRYIHPLLQGGQHPNLQILVETKIIRVIFDKSSPPRAIGVEYSSNKPNATTSSPCKPSNKIIRASKLVVVSAGAIGSPLVLERSGVGNESILKAAGIEIISAVPGVGENYQDHLLVAYPYKTNMEPEDTLDALFGGRKDLAAAIAAKDPQLGWNAQDIAYKLRPSEKDIAALGPDFRNYYDAVFKPFPTRPLMIGAIANCFIGDPSSVPIGQYVTMGTWTGYSQSRGHIHATSQTDLLTGYKFDSGFLSTPGDIKTHLWIYKVQREMARRLPYYRGEVESGHPSFSECSDANLNQDSDGKPVTRDIEYSQEDDEAIEAFIRARVGTMWHSLGTCAMKPLKNGGVVDEKLNVYGTKGLKVADMSIAPENVGANTYNTALTIGEKAAVIIAKDLRLKL